MNTAVAGRLLIVDDEAAQMKALCETLELEGYLTTGYSSPRQALAELREGQVDMLLTDLMMPEMDGITLLNAARQIDGNIAGVVMTGHGTVDTAVKAMQDGALDYILKPFRLTNVLSVVARALDVRRLRVENVAMRERERGYIAELEAANKDLEAFSCSVSHDLRAPLRAINGFCDMYLSEYGEGIPAAGHEMLTKVVQGAVRMDQLIEDLLRFCRFSRQPLLRRAIDLDRIVQKAIADLQPRETGRALEIRVGALPPCDGDASLLEQVFINLLSNAFKFTRGCNPAIVEIGCDEVEGESVLFVRDNGAGFNMEYADKLFGVFQRLHSATEFEGTGVGLSIVQRVVQRHGGRIWARSEAGIATTFYFTLPSVPADRRIQRESEPCNCD
jgi:two-component system sensor histidine kinase/response regulator